MPDVFTKRKRSEVMARIRGRGNKDTEVALAKLLRANGIAGWRRQHGLRFTVKGSGFKVRIDFVFPRERVVVFVDGCFWHGCPIHSHPAKWLKKSSMGKTTRFAVERRTARGGFDKLRMTNGRVRTGKQFWAKKMAGNMARDRLVNRTLRKEGWRVIRVWEHSLRNPGRVIARIARALKNS
jgi:DNA mismatch endonuclease (patch repair protein)